MGRIIRVVLTICACLTTYPLFAQTPNVDANGNYAPNYDPKSGVSLPIPQQGIPGQVYQDMVVEPGDYILAEGVPQCRDGRISKAGEQATALSTALITNAYPALAPIAQYGGAMVGQFVSAMQAELAKSTAGTLASLFSNLGLSPRYAACGTAVLVVPMGYHITGRSFLAQNNAAWRSGSLLLKCDIPSPPYLKCPLPDGLFANTGDGNVTISTFINWSRDTRFVRVVVFFEADASPFPPQ